VYVYAGVLNYETVYRMLSLFGIWYTCIMKLYINFMGMLDYRMMIEVFSFLSVFDRWM